jgi:chitinase
MKILNKTATLAAVALIGASLFQGCAHKTDPNWSKPFTPVKKDKEIIGYYAGWTLYARNGVMKPINLAPHYKKWTRMNFAFYHPDSNGKIWLTDTYADGDVLFGPSSPYPTKDTRVVCLQAYHPRLGKEERCYNKHVKQGLVELAHAQGVEVWPSIGGWTLSHHFSKIAEDPKKRATFASESVRLLREYNLDGIDIDWEYPAYAEHSGRPQDKENYILFMKEIKDSIIAYGKQFRNGREYKLTAALGCGPSRLEASYKIPELVKIMDEFNLMTYDFNGHWSEGADHNSPLFESTSPRTGLSVSTCAEDFMRAGVPANRISIGAGFYGRGVVATELRGPISKDSTKLQKTNSFGEYALGVDFGNWATYEGSPLYWNILQRYHEMDHYWDDVAKVPYGVFKNKSGFVSYENERSMKERTDWMKKSGINGVIVWEVSGDVIPVPETYPLQVKTPLADVLYDELLGKNAKVMPTAQKVKPKEAPKVEAPKVEEKAVVNVAQMKQKAKIALRGVYFASGKTELLSDSYAQLDEVAAGLIDNPDVVVEISGHTDNVGKPAANLKLSQGRAAAVVDYLKSKGVDTKQLQTKGYGANKPVSSNKTESGRAQNRRIEMMRVK